MIFFTISTPGRHCLNFYLSLGSFSTYAYHHPLKLSGCQTGLFLKENKKSKTYIWFKNFKNFLKINFYLLASSGLTC